MRDFAASDEAAFRAEIAEFVADALPQEVRARHALGRGLTRDQTVDWQRRLAERGWAAPQWPVEWGGAGWSTRQQFVFEDEMSRRGAPQGHTFNIRMIGPILLAHGSEAQKRRFLPPALTGEDWWCQGYSEPGAGSDLAALTTRARREGGHYVVDGSKIWTSGGQHANWMFCLVRTDPEVSAQRGITFLLVPMDQPGVTVTPIVTMAGDHEVNQVFLDDAKSHVGNRIGDEGQGWTIAKFLLENERGGSCFAPKLIADIDQLALTAAKVPSGTNGALIHDTEIARKLASLRLRARAFEISELRILAEIAKGRPPGPQTSLVKLFSANLRQELDTLAMEIHGLAGLQLPAERPLYGNEAPEPVGSVEAQMAAGRYLNSRAWTIFGGSDEVQKNIIAKTVLGL